MITSTTRRAGGLAAVLVVGALAVTSMLQAQDRPGTAAAGTAQATAGGFDAVADKALAAMTKRAQELGVKGVAVVAYVEGETVKGWSSKMAVVGSMTEAPAGEKRGANLLGIAYAKASEMAETLKDSGRAGRPPMTGEFGWQGGVIQKGRSGYLVAAFSGGPSEDDVKISRAGLEVMGEGL